MSIPDGATAILDVTGTSLTTVTLGGSAGNGSNDCTLGAGPGARCLNGASGTDGQGGCATELDCQSQQPGVCSPTINCYFGPPIPIPNDIASACVLDGFQTQLCGSLDLTSRNATFATSLLAAVYLTQNPDAPCPQCLNGTCSGGPNVGQACTGVGSKNTTLECPPDLGTFVGALSVSVPALGTATSQLVNANSLFCPGKIVPGAMGFDNAVLVQQTGTPLGGSTSLSMVLAGVFCVPATGSFLDGVGNFPAVGAFSASGSADLSQVLPLLPGLP